MLVNLGRATNATTLDTMPTTAEVPPDVLVVGVLIALKTALPLKHNPQNVETAQALIGPAIGVALA
jgi:hypothetical protein